MCDSLIKMQNLEKISEKMNELNISVTDMRIYLDNLPHNSPLKKSLSWAEMEDLESDLQNSTFEKKIQILNNEDIEKIFINRYKEICDDGLKMDEYIKRTAQKCHVTLTTINIIEDGYISSDSESEEKLQTEEVVYDEKEDELSVFYEPDKYLKVNTPFEFTTQIKNRVSPCISYKKCENKKCKKFHIDSINLCPLTFKGELCQDLAQCKKIHIKRCNNEDRCRYKDSHQCSFLHANYMPDAKTKQKFKETMSGWFTISQIHRR